MKLNFTFLMIVMMTAGVSVLNAQMSPKDGSYQELPQFVDFEEFNGVNLSEIYPGWQEGKGYQQPQYAGGAWFSADQMHNSKTAAVGFSFTGLKDEWIISPQFMATETTVISFKAALSRFWDDPVTGNLAHNDSISILVSTNTSQFDFAHLVHSFKLGNTPGWELERYQFDLSNFAGQLIHLAFYATNGQEANSLAAFHLDDIVIKNAVGFDAIPLELVSPVANTCFADQTPITVLIQNDGLEPITSVPVRVRVRGAVNENFYGIYEGTLQPGEQGLVHAGYIENGNYGQYTFSVETELPGDEFQYNNALSSIVIDHPEPVELPLPFMNFMGFFWNNLSDIYPGWYEARGKDYPRVAMDTDWQGTNFDGARTANVFFAGLGTEDWMVGPKFNATENLVVELRAAAEYIQGGTQMGSDDKLAIMISADCGETWQEAAAIKREDNLTASLQPFSFSIPDYADQEIILAFYATTGNVSDPQQYIVHVTDIDIKNLFDYDAGVTRILSPGASCGFSDEEELIVEVKNFGFQTISDFQIAYSLNGADPVVETISQSLDYNDVISYTFTSTLDLTQQDDNVLSVWTMLENDEYAGNDGLMDIPLLLSSHDLAGEGQYTMGFEEHEDFSDWLVEDGNNDGTEWELINDPVHAHSGSFSFAYFSNQTSSPSNDWLFSPCFFLQEGITYNVSFWYKNRASNWPESLKLMLGNSQHSSSMNVTLIDLGHIANPGYLKAEVEFTVDESGEYYFGWHAYGSADQFGMHIDDITVYQVFDQDLALLNFRAERNKDENCVLDNVDEIQLRIWNAGTEIVSQISVAMEIDHADPIQLNADQVLEAGETAWVSFTAGFVLDAYQLYHLNFYVTNVEDQNSTNDTLTVENFLHSDYNMGFEADEDFSGWNVQSLEGVNEWHVREGADQANSGTQALAIRTDGAGGNTANDDWAITDCFHLEAGKCYEISFWYRSWFSTENLAVYMGTDNDHSAMDILLIDLPEFNSNAYLYASYQFTVEEDGTYYFGWHTDGGTSGRYYIFVDDIKIIEDVAAQPVADPYTEILDLEVFFSANAENYSFLEWDFGDGNTSNEANVYHVYEATGTYDVVLTLGGGCVDAVYEFSITIDCIMDPDFEFTVDGTVVTFAALEDAAGYQWEFGDGTMGWGHEITHDYAVEESQTFTVTLTAFYNCGNEVVEKQVQIDITGVDDLTDEIAAGEFLLYPNPAHSTINIVSTSPMSRVTITDLLGKVVYDNTVSGKSEINISVGDLNTGLYLVHVYGEGDVMVKKLQVNR
ncbi:MAG: choice-of-anchor J domain-containing protein [Bacteroidales bacterium]|nr:choice-of-anchor J domain-containing protein [Bacteroidales bacterium]